MTTTAPFTESDDVLNAYIRLQGSTGPLGAEVDLVIRDQTFDAGAGVDTFNIDAGIARAGRWFTLAGSESGVITLTNSSGGSVAVSNLEKLQFQDVTIDLGTSAANTLSGTAGNDRFLFGLAGNDTINGLAGDDLIYGGAGADVLLGGDGNDMIVGGFDRDLMTGGAGKDVFDFNTLKDSMKVTATRDVIKDFGHGVDKIDLKTIDANAKLAGDQAFKFIGAAAFHKVAGGLHLVQTDAAGTAHDTTIVLGDVNGDGVADFSIELSGLKALTAVDFVL